MKRPLIAVAAAMFLLTGCASTDAEPTTETTYTYAASTPTESPNVEACEVFELEVNIMVSDISNSDYDGARQQLDNMETTAISADGYVRELMLKTVDDLPEPDRIHVATSGLFEYGGILVENTDRLAKQCAQEGYTWKYPLSQD